MRVKAAAFLLLACPILAVANSGFPPNDQFYTGSKTFAGEKTCAECHDGGLNTSSGNVKITFNGAAATSYTPGATIPIQITITDTGGGRRVWGFELAARFSSGANAGTLSPSDSHEIVQTLTFPNAGKQVITHNNAVAQPGTTFTYTINWKGPATGSGSVIFSAAGNAGNGDGNSTGDRIYTAETMLTEGASTGGTPPSIGSGGVVNAASFNPAPNNQVAKGQLVSIFGSNFLPAGQQAHASAIPLPTSLSNVSVAACGQNIPLIDVFPGQINGQLPFECQDTGTAGMTVTSGTQTSGSEPVKLALGSPGVFSVNVSGTGPGVIFHSDNVTLVTSSAPAKAGEIVVIYCTGLGAVNPATATGKAASGANDTVNPVTVSVGGTNANVVYKGLVVGFVGLYQVNATIPSGLGTQNAALSITVGSGNVSRTGITVAVAP